MSTPYPEWFRRLRTYYASHSARMFVLHFNVDDYVLNPYPDTNMPTTRVIPLLERYARRYIDDGKGCFQAFFRYSHSLSVEIGDASDDTLERIVLSTFGMVVGASLGNQVASPPGVLTGSTGGVLASRVGIQANDQFSADVYRQFAQGVSDLPSPERVLRTLEQVLKHPHQRSLVIIEHVENLAPRDMPSPDQIVNAEILKRLATDYEFRSTDNLCVLITRDLSAIDPGVYAPGTNCFPIQINLPSDEERATFLQLMERENSTELVEGSTGQRRMRRTLISGLAAIDHRLQEALQRGKLADTRDEQIRAFGKLTQGFRLVEIDQLNRQVRAQYAIDHPPATAATESLRHTAGPQVSWGDAVASPAPQPMASHLPQLSVQPGSGPIISVEQIKEHKRRAIEEQSGGLLEIVDVQRGFAAIGGMAVVKRYLATISA
ncbi:MAG: hypothetical protein HGA19_14230, partial [Oscillochloris sp.]|nr:hypothetical protein [Oscillochloris sp.]